MADEGGEAPPPEEAPVAEGETPEASESLTEEATPALTEEAPVATEEALPAAQAQEGSGEAKESDEAPKEEDAKSEEVPKGEDAGAEDAPKEEGASSEETPKEEAGEESAAGGESKEPVDPEMEKAAIKIQAAQRGVMDRKAVTEAKEKGELRECPNLHTLHTLSCCACSGHISKSRFVFRACLLAILLLLIMTDI